MFDNIQISKQDDWEFFPVYTGMLSTAEAFKYFERVRNTVINSGGEKETIDKLRWVPTSAKTEPGFEHLNYLPYIIILDVVIEVKDKNIEKIRDFFRNYIILKEEEDC